MRVGYEWCTHWRRHPRLAYSELHPDDRAATVTGFVERGLAFFARAGHHTETADVRKTRGPTPATPRWRDSWPSARSTICSSPPRRPQVNGKVERYQQTLKREWALGQTYRSSEHRADALTYWLRHYNEHRPHSAIGGHPPISRVPQPIEAGQLGAARSGADGDRVG